jgi:hypothetical protein
VIVAHDVRRSPTGGTILPAVPVSGQILEAPPGVSRLGEAVVVGDTIDQQEALRQ